LCPWRLGETDPKLAAVGRDEAKFARGTKCKGRIYYKM